MTENGGGGGGGPPPPGEEVLKRRFEFFKHMTTVSTATTVAVVAVYSLSEKVLTNAAKDQGWEDWVILFIPGFAIGGFFFSLLFSLWGLYLVTSALSPDEYPTAIPRMLKWSVIAFNVGLGMAVAMAILSVTGDWIAVVAAVVAAVVTIIMSVVFPAGTADGDS